jgi:hypothetical protein
MPTAASTPAARTATESIARGLRGTIFILTSQTTREGYLILTAYQSVVVDRSLSRDTSGTSRGQVIWIEPLRSNTRCAGRAHGVAAVALGRTTSVGKIV